MRSRPTPFDDDGFEERAVVKIFPSPGQTYPAVSTSFRHSNVSVYVNTGGDPGHYGSTLNIYARTKIGRGPVLSQALSSVPAVAALPQIFSVNNVGCDGFDVEIVPSGTPTTNTAVTAVAYGWESSPLAGNAFVAPTGTGFVQVSGGTLVTYASNVASTFSLNLVNGENVDINVGEFPGMLIALIRGPTANFFIDGIIPPSPTPDGCLLRLINAAAGAPLGGSGHAMTVRNQSATEPNANNRIYTGTGADAVFVAPPANGFSTVDLFYSTLVSSWLMVV